VKSKRTTINRDTAVQRIDEMVRLIEENALLGLDIKAALIPSNEIVVSDIRQSEIVGAGCYNTLKYCMALHLALTLARLFDPGARRNDANRMDIASIPLLVRLLKQKRCRAILVARARRWTPHMPRLADAHAAACERAIDGAIQAYAKLRATPDGRKSAETLKNFRNQKLAHSLIGTVLKELPRYSQLLLLMDVARDVANHTTLAVRGDNLDLKEIEIERHREACKFWKPALKAVISAEAEAVPA
jgi:hypothetical protein